MEIQRPQVERPSPPSTHRRMVAMLLAVAVLLGLLAGFNLLRGRLAAKARAGAGEPPQTVTAAEAREEAWQPALQAVGTFRARQGADLAFEVAGVVVQIHVAPGSEVRQGQALVSLNDGTEAGQLRQLQAAATLAEASFRRARDQFAARILSSADFEAAEADYRAKEAAVQSQRALVAKKHLVAPFPGRVGIVAASPGAYLNPGTAVVTLQRLDPIYLDFHLPQRDMGLAKPGQRVEALLDAFPGRTFTGRVTTVNPKVDLNTRNVQVEATFRNPEDRLVPGMFANVKLDLGDRTRQLTLPQTAVTYNPYGTTVFVAKGDAASGYRAQQVFVTTGATRGDQVAILQGLRPGDLVVTSGSLKLRNGTPLKIDNRVRPSEDPHPTPQER